jgi:hypothetical protein
VIMNRILNNKFKAYLLIFLFLLIYLIFPSQNSSIDAYDYAANIKWGHDIFFPHHLLYNAFHFLIYKFLIFIGLNTDVLALMKAVNAFFAAFCLLALYLILKAVNPDNTNKTIVNKNLALILFAGSSFAFMRFATENETYIIPLFWSLLASYYFLKHLQNNQLSSLFLSGLFATIACLFHQIHILWYVGLFLGIIIHKRSLLRLLAILIPGILIPFIYYIAFLQKHFEFTHAQNLWQFALYDYFYGAANTRFGANNFVLGLISFTRSFVQVHGIIPVLLKKSVFYLIAPISLLIFIGLSIRVLLKTKPKQKLSDIFIKTHILIFILQFAFAIFSEGNAEFMVMLPMLFILIINGIIEINYKATMYAALAMLVWNISFGLFPNYNYDFQNNSKTIDFINTHQGGIFILSDDVLVQNMIYYKTGKTWDTDIYKSPASLKSWGKDNMHLQHNIDSCLNNNILIYTDCIDELKLMSRKNYLQNDENELFFKNYEIEKVDSVETFTGIRYFYMIKGINIP